MRLQDANPTLPQLAVDRCTGQKRAILERLTRGPVTNTELIQIAQRFGARIQELRELVGQYGFEIVTESVSEARGVYRYQLRKAEGGDA